MISQSLEIPYFLSIYAHVCLHFLFYWTWIHSPISVVLFHYKLFSLISLSRYFTNSIFPIWNQFNHVLLCQTLCSENHSSCIHYKSLVSTNKTQPPTLLRIFLCVLPSYLPLTCFTVSSKLKLFSLVSYSKPAFQWMSLFPTFQRKQKMTSLCFNTHPHSCIYVGPPRLSTRLFHFLQDLAYMSFFFFFFFFSISNHLI